uniref:Uncharacterized protein n=1 Tax=Brassica campestris TaxID=3711 RepID=M4E2M2_BRACM
MQLRTLRFVLENNDNRQNIKDHSGNTCRGEISSSSEKTKSEWVCTSFTTPSYLKSEEKVPEDILVERVVGRRLDPVTGKIYHLKYSPPETEEIAARLTQRLDDTEEKLQQRETLLQFHF